MATSMCIPAMAMDNGSASQHEIDWHEGALGRDEKAEDCFAEFSFHQMPESCVFAEPKINADGGQAYGAVACPTPPPDSIVIVVPRPARPDASSPETLWPCPWALVADWWRPEPRG